VFFEAQQFSLHIQHPLPALPQFAVRPDVAIERCAGGAQFGAEFADTGLLIAHRRLRQAHLRFREGEFPAALASPGAGGGESRFGALPDEFAFELRQRRENPEDELAAGRGGVDVCPLTGEHFETDPPVGEVLRGIDEVAEVPAEPVELPDEQDVPLSQGFEAGQQPRPVVALAGCLVVVEVFRPHARCDEGIFLEVEYLAAVGLGDAGVADEEGGFHGIGGNRGRERGNGGMSVSHKRPFVGQPPAAAYDGCLPYINPFRILCKANGCCV
jgi:hypothetical protein